MSSRPDSSCARLDRHGRNSASSCVGSRVQHPICCRPSEHHCTAARRLRRRRRRVLHVLLPPPPRPSVRPSVCPSVGRQRANVTAAVSGVAKARVGPGAGGYTGASFRGAGAWRGQRTPQRLQNEFFCATPKAENGQSTVKRRDWLIFQAPKCTENRIFP